MKSNLLVAFLVLAGVLNASGQNSLTDVDKKMSASKEDPALRFYFNEEESRYFQVTFLNQLWIRYLNLNPGSTIIGENASESFDIGLRRTRMQFFGQVTDNAFLYFQFGMNNFNRMNGIGSNRKIAAFFHDAVVEYKVSKKNQLKLGGGLTIANGLSRFSQPSIGSILTLDVPVFAQATVDQTDEFSRKLSVYARGQVGKFDYRFSLSDPFPITSSGTAITPISDQHASFAQKSHRLQYQTYIMYQFFEQEPHSTPYMSGTYLGKKKILSLGGGIIYQPKAMWLKKTNGIAGDTITYQDMLLWSTELFADLPLNREKQTGIHFYLGYFNYDFGTNYIRRQQQMNPADANIGTNSPTDNYISGGGNGVPLMGTGSIVYIQGAYLLKKELLGEHGTLQPFVSCNYSTFTYLDDPSILYDAGINWLIKEHRQKISLDVQSRPVFNHEHHVYARKLGLVLQYQLSI